MMRNNRNIGRNKFRSNDRGYRQNGSKTFKNNSNNNFQRRHPGRNNHNAPRLIEKYNDLAREALSNGDKILSENYFQHADHFLRISLEQSTNASSQRNENNQSSFKSTNVETLSKKEGEKLDTNVEIKE